MIQAKINPVPILAMLVLGAALAIVASCGKSMPDPTFVNDAKSLLRIDNDLEQRFVFFRGLPSPDTYLGGVPGKARDFGLKTGPGAFVLTAAKIEDYMIFRTNASLIPLCWSRAVVVGKQPAKAVVRSILTGRGGVRFENNTDAFVEIRAGSWTGTNIAVIAPRESRIQNLPYRDFVFYPVRLDWQTNGDVITARETRLSNSANMAGVYPKNVQLIQIK